MPTRLPEITCTPRLSPSIVFPAAFRIWMPSSALPRSAVPVESVPIKLSRTMTPVAVAPEIKMPIRLAEMTLPGPIEGAG